MGTAHGIRKTSKSDLYRTPYQAIKPLNMIFSDLRNKKILDPSEGDGRIKKELSKIHPSNTVTGFDLFPDTGEPADFLQHKGDYDYVITNPPFSVKGEFIEHGLEVSEHVVFLFNMSVVSYNIFHKNYLDIPEYQGRLLMTPKVFMNSEGTFKAGGTDAYAWFFWKRGNKTRGSFEHYIDIRNLK